jgi:hypothetical protein
MACERDQYIQQILDLYRQTPGTRGRVRPADRRLAETLYQRDTCPELIRAALLLAAARRTFRPTEAEPLQPIASLHYFLPVIRELQDNPVDPGYVEYLRAKLAGL